jgi:hypothetical protein
MLISSNSGRSWEIVIAITPQNQLSLSSYCWLFYPLETAGVNTKLAPKQHKCSFNGKAKDFVASQRSHLRETTYISCTLSAVAP